MPRVWRRYSALTPQERAINGWRKLRNTLVSLPAPLRYQYAGPRTACRGGINRPGYRTHQSDHWVYRFSGAGSGDISGVLPSARARTARPEMQRFAGPRGFKTPDDMAARRQSGRISSSPYQSSAAIFVFTMPNDGAGTHARSVFIRVTRTHTDQHITHCIAPFFTSTYHAPHITYQRQRRLL